MGCAGRGGGGGVCVGCWGMGTHAGIYTAKCGLRQDCVSPLLHDEKRNDGSQARESAARRAQ